ncbi:MAG TPA: right-handed parallel beta-helix repeat-containing protein, partial [Minicystis sp.]|nr:right-handed parallel beta-helix repeat-containing protein [Minicystis sp.]
MRIAGGAVALALVLGARAALAVDADPSNYTTVLPTLQPGDTLDLASGTYTDELDVTNLNGSAAAPITIRGPADGSAVFAGNACCNTVEITNSSYVVIQNLTIDGGHLDGVFGVSAKGDTQNLVHHVTIEGCTFRGQDASQQTDAISTKTPTWGWVIRRNVIRGAGTGLYLGNSDGSDPFVEGVIEENLVEDTIGYNIEIKFQNAWPNVAGLPTGTTSTIVRNNVFIKNDAPSPDGDRPNLLVGGFPASGPGSQNLYEIYGNFFFHNPRESLLQASGRVSIHDNVFVDASDKAIDLVDHDLPLELAHVYNNTIYAAQRGIHFGNAAPEGDLVFLNLVFAATPIDGPIANQAANMTDTAANAGMYVNAPSLVLGQMDFYPRSGKCQGAPYDASAVASETDYDED